MSATTTQMTTATVNIEAALVALGSAFASYDQGRATAKAARQATHGIDQAEAIDNACGSAQLARVVAGRLAALGLESVLFTVPAQVTPMPAAWVTGWNTTVVGTVP